MPAVISEARAPSAPGRDSRIGHGKCRYDGRLQTNESDDVGGSCSGSSPWTFAALDVQSPESPGLASFGVARLKRGERFNATGQLVRTHGPFWRIDEGLSVDWRNRSSAEVNYSEEFTAFEEDFRNRQVGLAVGYNTREYQQVLAGYEFGRNFGSDYQLVTGRVRLLPDQLAFQRGTAAFGQRSSQGDTVFLKATAMF